MPKMLILTSSFPPLENDFAGCVVLEFAKSLSHIYEIEVLTPASLSAKSEESWGNIKISRFNYLPFKRLQSLDSARDLQPLLEKSLLARLEIIPFFIVFCWKAFFLAKSVDVICSHWLVPSALVGSLITLLQKKKHLVIEHSGALNFLNKLFLGRYLLKFIAYGSKNIVVVSQELKEKLLKLAPELVNKTSVIPMGVDCNFYQPKANSIKSQKTILFLGRLVKIKGVDILLKALANCLDIKLLIAGDGEQRKELEELAIRLNAPAKFLGTVTGKTKLELLQSCDLVVIPSIILPDGRTEGTPLVCLEAFACAKAVIASDVGGLSFLVIDGKVGYLSQPANIKELREKIFSLISDNNKLKLMGESARKLAEKYDWTKISQEFYLLLKQ
ncbi:MAG: glycosyltransferase family 4 protein [Blastocatellia bacterium]|nr:glycosyltransferase family 4 protein [Blastocatellia bacterium]